MSSRSTPPGQLRRADHLPPRLSLIAKAVAGDAEAIHLLANTTDSMTEVVRNRLGPVLAANAKKVGAAGPAVEAWHECRLQNAARRLLLDQAVHGVCTSLSGTEITHVLLKGLGLPPGTYARPDDRPTTDIDVLIRPEDLGRARRALQIAGWMPLHTGAHDEVYLREEGYNWQARDANSTLLELHFRLWGSVPESLAEGVCERSEPAQGLGTHTRRPTRSDAYVIAAVHLWVTPPPRPLVYCWDLHRLTVEAPAVLPGIVSTTRRHGLQLPVGVAADLAASLWPSQPNQSLAEELRSTWRATERLAANRVRRSHEPLSVPYGLFVAARLAARRPTRLGWRSVWRRVWPHRAILARAGDLRGWLPVRRLRYVVRVLRG